jgi:hypothetical protein
VVQASQKDYTINRKRINIMKWSFFFDHGNSNLPRVYPTARKPDIPITGATSLDQHLRRLIASVGQMLADGILL